MNTPAKPRDARYLPIQGSAWRLALGDTNGDGRNELICGHYEGALSCLDPVSGQTAWRRPLGGFPFAVAAADINGDGRAEAFAACADGSLRAFSSGGESLWSFHPNHAAKYAVAVWRHQPNQEPVIACAGMDRTVHILSTTGELLQSHDLGRPINHLIAADLDGNGKQDLLAATTRKACFDVLRLENDGIRSIRQQRLEGAIGSWGGVMGFAIFSAHACDLDGDGCEEIVAGNYYVSGSLVRLLSGDGAERWTSPVWKGPDTPNFETRDYYSMTLVRAGHLHGPSRPGQIAALTTGNIRLYSVTGDLLGEADAPLGFTDLVLDGPILYLGSSPNGDDTIYRIDLSGDWQRDLRTLRRRGLARRAGESLQAIHRQALRLPAAEDAHRKPYVFHLGRLSENNGYLSSSAEWFGRHYPYANFNVTPACSLSGMRDGLCENVSLHHDGTVLGPNPEGLPASRFVEIAETLEATGRPQNYYISHGCTPRITVDTLGRMLEAAPQALTGLVSHEDERPEKIPSYFRDYFPPLATRCATLGRTLTLLEKNVWWFDTPALAETGPALFNRELASVLVAGTDDANSRTPELNLFARLGLRQAGLIGHIMACPITDLYCFSRMLEWEYPKHGHPFFRLMVAHTVLGADYFHLRNDNFHRDTRFSETAAEAFTPFLHLLGKGIVFSPRPDQMAGLSRLGFIVHQPPPKWIRDAHNGHDEDLWETDPELDNAVLPHNGCIWGNTPTPSHSLSAVLFRKQRQWGTHIPATPYGPIAFVPAHADRKTVAGVDSWWHTDGVSVWREGESPLTGPEAAAALRDSFESAAGRLPFRPLGDDVFFHTVKVAPGVYRLFAIDPGWLDPADRKIEVRVQIPGPCTVHDVLQGEAIPFSGDTFTLPVPAGALRILEVNTGEV